MKMLHPGHHHAAGRCRLLALFTIVVTAMTCLLPSAVAFGSYLDQIQHQPQSQPHGDRTSSTAAQATATFAPVSTTTTLPRSTSTEDLMARYNLELLDDDDILKVPRRDKSGNTRLPQTHGDASTAKQPKERRQYAPAPPTGGGGYRTSMAAARSKQTTSRERQETQQTAPVQQPLGSAGDYFSSMSSSSQMSTAPKKSYGPAAYGSKYKTVADTGFNGFLSELSSAPLPPSVHAVATSSVPTLPIGPNIQQPSSRATSQTGRIESNANDKRSEESLYATPGSSSSAMMEAPLNSASTATEAAKSENDKFDSVGRNGHDSGPQLSPKSPAVTTLSSRQQPTFSSPLDVSSRNSNISASSPTDLKSSVRSEVKDASEISTAEPTRAVPDSDGNKVAWPAIPVDSVRRTSMSSDNASPRPGQGRSKLDNNEPRLPTSDSASMPLPFEKIKDSTNLASNSFSQSNSFPAPPVPLPLKSPEGDTRFKTVKYAHSPVGMFPAPPMPLPFEEPSTIELVKDVNVEPLARQIQTDKFATPLDRPSSTGAARSGSTLDTTGAPLQERNKSSYYGIDRGAEVSGSGGITYIPRSEIFGAKLPGNLRAHQVIASSSSGNSDVSITTQGEVERDLSSTIQSRPIEDRFNSLIQSNTERARKAKVASQRRAQAMQTLARNVKERKQTRNPLSIGSPRVHKAPAALIADLIEPAPVQGGSLKTWSFRNPALDRIHVALSTGGRPLNAELDLWRGPDDVPFKMRVYCENGYERPFSAVIETPIGPNTVSVRNSGLLEFPLTAHVLGEEDHTVATPLPSVASASFDSEALTVHGGALKTFAFDASVESVQVLLKTEGLPINATLELLQGPTNSKQSIHIYSEEGSTRPLFMVIETPGNGNVVRVVNSSPIEFPLIASVEPYSIGQTLSPMEPVISGDVIRDEMDPDETNSGFVRRLYNYGRNKWSKRS